MKGSDVKTIREGWETFAKAAIPPDASEIQRTEMHKAFYCGAMIAFQCATYGIAELSDDDGADVLARLDDELSDYAESVIASSIPTGSTH